MNQVFVEEYVKTTIMEGTYAIYVDNLGHSKMSYTNRINNIFPYNCLIVSFFLEIF